MNMRAGAAALASGLLLALALTLPAGEASAQAVCNGGTHTGSGSINCLYLPGNTSNIFINPGRIGIDVSGSFTAVSAVHNGTGNIEVRMTAGTVVGRNSRGLTAAQEGTSGNVVIRMSGGSIETRAATSYVLGGDSRGTGDIRIDMSGGTLSSAANNSQGIDGRHTGTGNIYIDMRGGSIATMGTGSSGITGGHSGTSGNITVSVTGGSIETRGTTAGGVSAGRTGGTGAATATLSQSGTTSTVVRTMGVRAIGVSASNTGRGAASVRVTGGLVETTGDGSIGLRAYSNYSGTGDANAEVVLEGGTVRTRGGVNVFQTVPLPPYGAYAERGGGSGAASVRMTGGVVETAAEGAHGLFALRYNSSGAVSVHMTSGAVTVAGLNARGLLGRHTGLGSIEMTTSGEATIAAPFAAGIEARATNDGNGAGCLLVTHGGAVEARDVGVLASAQRSSGYTAFGAPGGAQTAAAQTANDAARPKTEPMIHITSSGRITVGASVMDTFIRNRVEGADGALSTAEQAVLDAIMAGDETVLNTALGALPTAYDDDWKTEARNLLAKRAEPTGDAALAQRAGEEILGLSRAGVRATAIDHTAITDYVRGSDALSEAERTVLEAVLTGDGLEAALTAISGAAYTTAWKNQVRQHAATYNAGDIQVDVTGGSIDAEGNGVEALYAVLHDDNGDIAVSVAEGASVTGGANGIYVRNAGAGTGGLRAQSVTVNGMVTGGTGAGVHLVGGGTVTVGATGEVGATSGMGVLADGGALTATVSGTVGGDIRVEGGGALTLDVREGGAVTGTVRDPVGPLTVAGGIGRLLYSSGGAVTVTRTGRLTGIEVNGKTESLRSESGDLSVTVAGAVAGDLEAPEGGKLTLNVQEGGAVTGTVRDPVGPLTVAGGIGRILYSSGGAVTVASTGRLTGVDGVALRSDAGNLDLTVAAMGMVTGDIDARGDGDLKVSVSGTVTGDILGRGAGEHTVTVARGGVVSGTVDLGASEVTANGDVGRVLLRRGGMAAVGATGRLTGVDGVALRSDGGDLGVTVAGVAMGDIDARGDGDLTVMVAGTVDGDIFGRDAGVHRVTVALGGRVLGTIHLGGDGAVRVDGLAGRVRFENCGAVTLGPEGRIPGIDGRAVERPSSCAPAVTIEVREGETPDEARERIGKIVGSEDEDEDEDGPSVMLRDSGTGELLTAPASAPAATPTPAQTRVYEALPSVLLGMERPASHAVRAEAVRASNGTWARVEASRGSWKAASSANAGTAYDHRGFSFHAGLDAVLGEETRAGLSVHWRRATAEISQGGDVEARGVGVGLSATWSSGPVFVDGQAAATLYDLDLTSTQLGALREDVGAQGLSAALEAGRAFPVADGATVTPRARVAYSSLSLSEFDDSAGARVSLDRGGSLTGRAGALAERPFGEKGRIFGSVDIEREFEAETRMTVGGMSLETSGEETRWLAGVGAEQGWEDGRFTLRGALGYAGSGGGTRDYGGRASLSMRF